MKFTPQLIPDILLIELTVYHDERGNFIETFRQDLLEKAVGYKVNFVQENESRSIRGVIRGLHYQVQPFAQSKLIRVIKGSVLDVVVDIRKSSNTFGQHIAIELNEKNMYQLFIPQGFAHGFVVLSEEAILSYKVDNFYSPKSERGIVYDDQNLNIDWHFPKKVLKISEKDKSHSNFFDICDYFE